MIEIGPRLGDVVLIGQGYEKFDHVQIVGCVHAINALDGEIVSARSRVERTGFHDRLVTSGTEMGGNDVVAIEAVHCDHSWLARWLEPFHHHADGKNLVAHADSAPITVFAFPFSCEGFELFHSRIGASVGMCWVCLATQWGRPEDAAGETEQNQRTEHGNLLETIGARELAGALIDGVEGILAQRRTGV